MTSCSISSTWKVEERIITAVFVVGFLKFYDPSLTAYKVSEAKYPMEESDGGRWSFCCVTLHMCTGNINSGQTFIKESSLACYPSYVITFE